MSEPITVPEELMPRLIAVAEAAEMTPERVVTLLLERALDRLQGSGMPGWWLSLSRAEEGIPAGHVGLGKVLDAYDRWQVRPWTGSRATAETAPVDEGAATGIVAEEVPTPTPEEAGDASLAENDGEESDDPEEDDGPVLAALQRDDGVEVLVTALLPERRLLMIATAGERTQVGSVTLERGEMWADCSRDGWHRIMAEADRVADLVQASQD